LVGISDAHYVTEWCNCSHFHVSHFIELLPLDQFLIVAPSSFAPSRMGMNSGKKESDCLGASKHTSVAYDRGGVCSGELFGLAGMLRYK
jgi:hypothetical protein